MNSHRDIQRRTNGPTDQRVITKDPLGKPEVQKYNFLILSSEY